MFFFVLFFFCAITSIKSTKYRVLTDLQCNYILILFNSLKTISRFLIVKLNTKINKRICITIILANIHEQKQNDKEEDNNYLRAYVNVRIILNLNH